MEEWFPTGGEKDFEFKRILKSLQPYREDLTVLGGLDHHTGYALGDGGGDHARAGACYLTGVHPKKTSGADILAGVSVDQIIAAQQGSKTRFASLELGCDDTRTVGACDSGYSCAYQNSVSWRTPTSPMPPETNPRTVFERMFGTEDLSLAPEARARRMAARKSILDFASEDTKRLAADLGPADRRKIDEYLFAVREIEKRIESAEHEQKQFKPSIEKPAGVPVLFADYLKLMFDIQLLAIQADLTRTATFMVGREFSSRTSPEIGAPGGHHPLSHESTPASQEQLLKINVHHATQFAYYLKKLSETRDGDGSLLDHLILYYAASMSEGNHNPENLPVVIAGGGAGQLKGGSHLKYPGDTPLANLHLTVMRKLGLQLEKIHDSTGELRELAI